MPRLSKKTIEAVQKYGPSVQSIADEYGISGAALLAKLITGESGDDPDAVSSAGARGRAQFMPASRQTALQRYGVDAWSHDPDQAVHAAALHLRGLINGSKGLHGYNPGMASYPGYILGQKVGDVAHYGRGGGRDPAAKTPRVKAPAAPAPAPQAYTTRTVTTPGTDNSGLRRQLIGDFLQHGGVGNSSAVVALAGAYGQAADIPGSSKTTRTYAPQPQGPAPAAAPRGRVRPARNVSGARAALGWAESKIGFREATGNNDGGLAAYANKRFGMSNQPWCAMFTSLAVTKGGAPKTARTASVAEVRRQAQQGDGGYRRGFVNPARAKAGDLILFGNDHIGMVQSVKNGRINYVGGNQSNGVTAANVPVGHGDIVRPKYGARKK